MKNFVWILLLCLFLCVGCGKPAVEQTQTAAIGNPWSDWDCLEEAEAAVGFSFDLPEVIGERYYAVVFRTLNNEMLEIIYRDAESEVCVRKQKVEGQDISGDYNPYDHCMEESVNGVAILHYRNADNSAVKQLISYQGFSWSVVATDGYAEGSDGMFVGEILDEPLL